jgi:hypothetical protein
MFLVVVYSLVAVGPAFLYIDAESSLPPLTYNALLAASKQATLYHLPLELAKLRL